MVMGSGGTQLVRPLLQLSAPSRYDSTGQLQPLVEPQPSQT